MPSILIVDDEPNNFDVIEAFLSAENYRLYYNASGQQALDSLDTLRPDLVLLDVMMPGMDGTEVCRQVRSKLRWRSLPIIMVTALDSKEDLARCLEAGADDFISKPVNALELRARIKSFLRIKSQYDQLQNFSTLQRDTINLLGANLQELRGEMTSSLSYGLNSPLTSILGSIGMLRAEVDNMNLDRIHKYLDVAHESATNLERVTKKFMFLLQIESDNQNGHPQEDPQVFAIKPFLEHLVFLCAEHHGRAEDVVLNVEDIKIRCIHRYFQQIVGELMENALKNSPPQTPITITAKSHHGQLNLTLHNHGPAIAPEILQQLRRSGPSPTSEQSVPGLGLKIVQRITDRLMGYFKMASNGQDGTTASVTLPLPIVTD